MIPPDTPPRRWCDHCESHDFAYFVAPVIQSMAGCGTEMMRQIMQIDYADEPDETVVFYMDFVR